LLEEGWAFRVLVNRFHLKGRDGWRMPAALADSIGLVAEETRWFSPMQPELLQEVALTRQAGALVGSPIDVPLGRLGARAGDYVFFCVRGDEYGLILRARSEVHGADALGELLWSCGLDHQDEMMRYSPWRHLARALGGEARGRDEVRRRLERRRDPERIALLELVDARTGSGGWSDGWWYRSPALPFDEFFVVEGGEHGVRVAVGVADASGQPPRGLIQTNGGLLWLDQADGLDQEEAERLLREPPAGLVPAARRTDWNRWLHAEHVARRAGLAGAEWSVVTRANGWEIADQHCDGLVDALQKVLQANDWDVVSPRFPIRESYPRSPLAFDRLAEAAVRRGLVAIRGEQQSGFVAVYGAGREVFGASVVDVLGTA
jgi:hypothetical protein